MTILCIVGARPNFMKMAPVVRALGERGVACRLVHTGQHYDDAMSRVFFEELGLPEPDVHLGVGSDSHARQTASIMTGFEGVLDRFEPELVVVAGDVNSTLAAALVAAKTGVNVAHVEAGLRSFDRSMPEEVNRVLTDHVSTLLFTTEERGSANLRHEGIDPGRIHFVGNCMVDTLVLHLDRALGRRPWERFDVQPSGFALVTLHRPSNVDDEETLSGVMETLREVAGRLPVVFPVHPRTRDRLAFGHPGGGSSLEMCEPLPYLDFLGLMARAKVVLTDSGGIQEETTALGVPCLTMRENTERPVTIEVGTNRLVGTDRTRILEAVDEVLGGRWLQGRRPDLWDGDAGDRIASVIVDSGSR